MVRLILLPSELSPPTSRDWITAGDGGRQSRIPAALRKLPLDVDTLTVDFPGPDVGPKTRQLVTRPAPLRQWSWPDVGRRTHLASGGRASRVAGADCNPGATLRSWFARRRSTRTGAHSGTRPGAAH